MINPPSSDERRYQPARSANVTTGCSVTDCGTTVTYRSWKGADYTLQLFSGRYVDVLVPAEWFEHEEFGPEVRRNLVDGIDLVYQYLKDLVGREPAGAGRLPIAFVLDPGCGYGCGYIGSKGVEIGDDRLCCGNRGNYAIWGEASAGLAQNAIIHEMTHNFDVFSSYYAYFDNAAHYWTDIVNVALYNYSRSGTTPYTFFAERLDPDEVLSYWRDWTFRTYLRYPGASWQKCVLQNDCRDRGLNANEASAGFFHRMYGLYGPRVLEGYLRHLREFVTANPPPSSPHAKEDLLVEALAAGAGIDLSCAADELHWSLSSEARARLAASYLQPIELCADEDADGTTVLRGDTDDHDANIRPGAAELLNGIDDDCNGVIDELMLTETPELPFSTDYLHPTAAHAPAHLFGAATPGHYYRFDLGTWPDSQRFSVSLCSSRDFQGYVVLQDRLFSSDTAAGWWVSAGRCTSYAPELPRDLAPLNAYVTADSSGTYDLTIAPVATHWPLPRWGGVTVERLSQSYQFTSHPLAISQAIAPPTHVRFWVSGHGWAGTVPYSASAQLDWTPPVGFPGAPFAVRAQLVADGTPVTNLTPRTWVDPQALLLSEGRFAVHASWLTTGGQRGEGTAVQLTGDTGYFWFFAPANVEVVAKVVDACAHPRTNYWFFAAGLTNVDVQLRVTDLVTGVGKVYRNSQGSPFQPIQDTASFFVCN